MHTCATVLAVAPMPTLASGYQPQLARGAVLLDLRLEVVVHRKRDRQVWHHRRPRQQRSLVQPCMDRPARGSSPALSDALFRADLEAIMLRFVSTHVLLKMGTEEVLWAACIKMLAFTILLRLGRPSRGIASPAAVPGRTSGAFSMVGLLQAV